VEFDPLQLTSEASLNRTRLADLPGADPDLIGRSAYELLRLDALANLAVDHGVHVVDRSDGPRRLAHTLRSPDESTATAAQRVVAEFGRRLGHLLATLRVGAEEQARGAPPIASTGGPSTASGSAAESRLRWAPTCWAAAAGLPTDGHDGVVVLGTSLGAGFTLPGQHKLAIAPDLLVTRH
jgi:hypothetical protein